MCPHQAIALFHHRAPDVAELGGLAGCFLYTRVGIRGRGVRLIAAWLSAEFELAVAAGRWQLARPILWTKALPTVNAPGSSLLPFTFDRVNLFHGVCSGSSNKPESTLPSVPPLPRPHQRASQHVYVKSRLNSALTHFLMDLGC